MSDSFSSGAEARPGISSRLEESRVLVVEDYPQNRELIVRFLEFAGITADSAVDGKQALERFKSAAYDLVLMDIQLPVMDGCEVTRQIRLWETEQGRSPVPVVAISANSREVDRRRAREAGCTLFIPKPISPKGLLKSLSELLAGTPPN